MNHLNVKFITPDKDITLNKALSVSAVGVNGCLVILPDHEPSLIALYSGTISIQILPQKAIKKFFVINPSLEVKHNQCSIIADEVYDFNELKSQDLESRKKKVNHLLKYIQNYKLLEVAKEELSIIENMSKL